MELSLKKNAKFQQLEPHWFSFSVLYHCTHFYYIYIHTRMRSVFVIHLKIPIWKFKTSFVTSRLYQGNTSMLRLDTGYPMILQKKLPQMYTILIGFSIINHPFWGYHYFWKPPYIHTYCGIKYPKHRCNLQERSQETSCSSPGETCQ